MRGLRPVPLSIYTSDQLEKIGNTILYLCERIDPLYKTKLLKLVYLLDESSVKYSGIPMLGLEWKVWKKGPVVMDLYIELSDEPSLLREYISVEHKGKNTQVKARRKFNDDEFSDRDIKLLEETVKLYGRWSSDRLIELVHAKTGLWYKTAKENGLIELFDKEETTYSNVPIDLGELVKKDEMKAFMFREHQEFMLVHRALKR